jgi:7-carboxy-7-deazaguanine synthase
MEIDEIVRIVKDNTKPQNINHVVISGGEPMLQFKSLRELTQKLKEEGFHITLETNATIYDEEVAENIDLVSMSPKLSTSTPWESNLKDTGVQYNEKWANKHEKLRISIDKIQSFIDVRNKFGNDFQLKFVVADDKDIKEVESILGQLNNFEPSDIMLMPEGVNVDTLNKRTGWIAEQALMRGWRFCPRLHIMMFGKARYV